MTTPPLPHTVWEKSDRLLSGGAIVVRAAAVPHDGEQRAAVAITVRVAAGQFQLTEADGSVTATLLTSPGEALGMSAWLRQAALAADQIGPPLYDWLPDSNADGSDDQLASDPSSREVAGG